MDYGCIRTPEAEGRTGSAVEIVGTFHAGANLGLGLKNGHGFSIGGKREGTGGREKVEG